MIKGQEYILCAAIKYQDAIIAGRRHKDCYNTLQKLISDAILPTEESQGFLTSNDRFVGRKEAYLIAKDQDQLLLKPKENDKDEELTSEDLYYNISIDMP